MKKILFLLVVLCLGLVACRPGHSIDTINASTGTMSQTKLSNDMVRKAIFDACQRRGWHAAEISPGLIEARLVVRGKHTVVVSIPYTAENYTIKYKSSNNMEHKTKSDGTQSIHPNYNKWVNILNNEISISLARAHS